MTEEFYVQRIRQVNSMGLSKDQTIAECIASLAIGLDQLREEIQSVKELMLKHQHEQSARRRFFR